VILRRGHVAAVAEHRPGGLAVGGKASSQTGHGAVVALARDDTAASPLVVITTFVLVAVLLTVVIYALAFDRPETDVSLVAVRGEGGSLAFDVTDSSGGLDWNEVTLRFLDRGGSDVAGSFLQVPTGAIDLEDRVAVSPLPPAGTYLLLVFHGDDELSRLAVTI
jgi:hypothetical protein